jgi:RNA polymerase sigma-70 factor (ECF subfamily)
VQDTVKATVPVIASCSPVFSRAARDASVARARLTEALVATGHQDQQAFSDVYRLTSAKLFGICLRVCGDNAGAQDVLQDVYLKIWKSAGAFNPSIASPIAWLAVMARNRAIDWRRSQGRRTGERLEEAIAIADPARDPEALALLSHESRRLHSCLLALDKRQGDVIRSAFFEGLTYPEIARRADAPLGTVKSNIRRGLAKLRADLDMNTREVAASIQRAALF